MRFYKKLNLLFPVALFGIFLFNLQGSLAQEETKEDTYAISLVQTAEVDKDIVEVGDKKVLTEDYTVKNGDHLWQLLRERGLLKKQLLPEVLAVLRKLNSSLTNLNLIHPGDKIVIPLTISPIKGMPRSTREVAEKTVSIEDLEDMDLENYTVKSGDRLIKVIKERFEIPEKFLYRDYLNFVKKLNPSIGNLDRIYPGQIVRLPIYSPQIVRLPINKASPPPEPEPKEPKKDLMTLSRELGEIVNQMGEEWVQTGQHYIPLKSGGQVNLNADTYPIIYLANGNRVIVDVYGVLPEEVAGLVVSNWDNYKIVHLTEDDTLRSALGKILQACDYDQIYKYGEPFELVGDIPIRITADWIIKRAAESPDERDKLIMITFTENHASETPYEIKAYLENLGVLTIDYPSAERPEDEPGYKVDILKAGQDKSALVETLLTLSKQQFAKNAEIPLYKQEGSDYNLIVKADFYMTMDGKDSMIDLTGLGPEILSLLRQHHVSVLTLSNENDPSLIVSKTLDFLGIQSDSKPHPFMTAERANSKNIRITVPGITFLDHEGQAFFATPLTLPDEVANFLSRKGYKILSLGQLLTADKGR